MKKNLICIAIALVLFFIPHQQKVNAVNVCPNRTLVDYRELLKNVKIYTDYRIVDGKALFDVTITNIPYSVYIEDVSTGITYQYENFTTQNELIIKNYEENQKINYRFYTKTDLCYGKVLGTRTVILPNYNENSTDSLCAGIQEFSFCQKWGGLSASRDELEKKTEEYREKKQNQGSTGKPKTNRENIKNKVIEFIVDYYLYLVATVAVIVLILVAIKVKATEKNELDFKV